MAIAPGCDSVFSDKTEEPVCFVSDSRSKIDSGGGGAERNERKKIPQAIDLEWRRIGFTYCFNESAGCRNVIVDRPVAKIANPELTVHQSESPRGIELTIRNQAFNESAAGSEYV